MGEWGERSGSDGISHWFERSGRPRRGLLLGLAARVFVPGVASCNLSLASRRPLSIL